MAEVKPFDRTVLKVGQLFVIGLNVAAFALGFVVGVPYAWLLGTVVGIIMIAGLADDRLALFKQFYLRVLKPRGILKPNVVQEDASPHQFAQGVGGAFLLAAAVAFVLGATVIGWALTWVVIILAFVNFAFDFCVGCQVYFILDRMHLLPQRG